MDRICYTLSPYFRELLCRDFIILVFIKLKLFTLAFDACLLGFPVFFKVSLKVLKVIAGLFLLDSRDLALKPVP